MNLGVSCEHCGDELKLDMNQYPPGTAYTCPNCEGACMVSPAMVGPGVTLDDFTIVRLLGKGGMGEVYLAQQNSMEREVALKLLPVAFSSQKDYVARFRQEVRMAARLKHPNIVRAYKAGEVGGIHFLAMDYVDGESVKLRLKRAGAYPEDEALKIIAKVASALGQVWEKHRMIHRDVKPDNIMIDEYGEPLLMDMGLSKIMDGGDGVSMPGSVLGTPNYMSPEQAQSDPDLDFQSDMYSLGVTLHHMLTGTMPFYGSSVFETLKRQVEESLPDPRKSNPQISDRTVAIMRRMLAKERADRFGSWQELVECLKGAPMTLPEGADEADFSSLALAGNSPEVKAHQAAMAKRRDQPATPATSSATGNAKLPWVFAAVAIVLMIGAFWIRGRGAGAEPLPPALPQAVATTTDGSPKPPPLQAAPAPPVKAIATPAKPPTRPSTSTTKTPEAIVAPTVAPGEIPVPAGKPIVTPIEGAPGEKMVTRLKIVEQVAAGPGGVSALALSADGKLIAAGTHRGDIGVWDATTLQRQTLIKGLGTGPYALAFSNDGKLLAAGGRDMTLKVYDVASGRLQQNLNRGGNASKSYQSLLFLPGDKRLLAGNSEMTIQEWNAETGALVRAYQEHTHHVNGLRLSPDKTRVASHTWAGGVSVWEIGDPMRVIKRLPTASSMMFGMTFAADGKTIYTGGNATKVFVHELGARIRSKQAANVHAIVYGLDAAPGGAWVVATTMQSDQIYLIDGKTHRVVVTQDGKGHKANDAIFFPDAPSRFVTAGGDGTVAIWEIQSVPESEILRNQPPENLLLVEQKISHDHVTIPPWQTFTATVDGFLPRVEIGANIHPDSGGAFRIYEGDGINGTVLHEEQWSAAKNTNEARWAAIELTKPLPVKKDAVYTWYLEGAAGIFFAKNNPYPDGHASAPSYDMCFRLHFTEAAP